MLKYRMFPGRKKFQITYIITPAAVDVETNTNIGFCWRIALESVQLQGGVQHAFFQPCLHNGSDMKCHLGSIELSFFISCKL